MPSLLQRNVRALANTATHIELAQKLSTSKASVVPPIDDTQAPLRLPEDAEIVFLGVEGVGKLTPLLQSNRHLTIVEPELERLAKFFTSQDLSAALVSDRLRVVSPSSAEELRDAWQALSSSGPRMVLVDGAGSRCSSVRRELLREAQRIIESVERDRALDTGATLALGPSAVANAVHNLGIGDQLVFTPPSPGSSGQLSRPALVVGAGPSLDQALAAIGRLAESHWVIAVDTAAGSLVEAGVSPDFVVAVDPRERNTRHLDGLSLSSSVLFRDISSNPLLSVKTAAKEVFFVSNNPIAGALARLGLKRVQLDAFGSVSTAAFEIACELKASAVIFVGHDLAFSGEQEYSVATASAASPPTPDDEVCWERDIHGRTVRTTQRLVCFRDWLQQRVAARRRIDSRMRFLNASGAGILGGGLEQSTIRSYESNPQSSDLIGSPRDCLMARDTHDGLQSLSRLERRARRVLRRLDQNRRSDVATTLAAMQGQPEVLGLAELLEGQALIDLRRQWAQKGEAVCDAHARSLRHIFRRATRALLEHVHATLESD